MTARLFRLHTTPLLAGMLLCCLSVVLGVLIAADASAMPRRVYNQLQSNSTHGSISPNPGSMRLYRDNGNSWGASSFDPPGSKGLSDPAGSQDISTQTGFKHLLKNERTSLVRQLTLRIYYPTRAQASAARFQVHQQVCRFTQNGDSHRLSLSINGKIVRDRPATANNMSNACDALPGVFSIPEGADAPYAHSGSNMFYNELIFKLDGQRNNTDQAQQVRFQVRATGNGIIGLEKNTPSTEFGVVEAFNEESYGLALGIPFARSCSESAEDTEGRVQIYDVDEPDFGYMYAAILKRADAGSPWTRLQRWEYNDNKSGDAVWQAGANRRWRLSGESGDTSFFYIKNFKRDWDYLLVIDNPHQEGRSSPTGNVLSFSLPGDSINAQIGCQYELVPSVERASSGTDYIAKGTITKSGDDRDRHDWHLSVITSPTRPDLGPRYTDNNLYPCDWRQGPDLTCTPLLSGVQPDGFPNRTFTTDPVGFSGADLPPGTWVCFMMSVSKPLNTSGFERWRHSRLECSDNDSKKPAVHFLGNDLKVTGDIKTSSSLDADSKRFGSWVEYGVFSTGANTTVSSGAGLRNGRPEDAASNWSMLTFANTAEPYGNYSSLPFASTARSRITSLTPTSSYNGGAPLPTTSGVYEYTGAPDGTGTLTIPGGSISESGASVIIYAPNANVVIDGNITVSNSDLTNVRDISQVVILAQNISINKQVGNIDAWLMTRPGGSINTCGDEAADPAAVRLTITMCEPQLNINGVVMTSKLHLMRTFGADAANPAAAAEVFRLRPDAQLWAYSYFSNGDRAQTVHMRELPPRF